MRDSTRIPPDTKDWTWTLEHRCPDCGLAAGEVPATDVVDGLERALARWPEVLQRADVHIRRDPARWSDLEYACHVRDVCGVFTRRLQQLRQEDDPIFVDWDQDETAREGEYSRQTPSAVATELTQAAALLIGEWGKVGGEEWSRAGRRSDGSEFTVLTLGQYCLHDLTHHGVDVGLNI